MDGISDTNTEEQTLLCIKVLADDVLLLRKDVKLRFNRLASDVQEVKQRFDRVESDIKEIKELLLRMNDNR